MEITSSFQNDGTFGRLGLRQDADHGVVFEACVCNLGEHALLYKDGEDAHGLFEKSHSVASKRSIQLANNSFYSNCLLNEFNAASQVHTKFNELPCNAFFLAPAQTGGS